MICGSSSIAEDFPSKFLNRQVNVVNIVLCVNDYQLIDCVSFLEFSKSNSATIIIISLSARGEICLLGYCNVCKCVHCAVMIWEFFQFPPGIQESRAMSW